MRLSVLLPTARPEFGVKDNWNYKVLTLLSTSTLITAGLEDLWIQKMLEHRETCTTVISAPMDRNGMNNPSAPGHSSASSLPSSIPPTI